MKIRLGDLKRLLREHSAANDEIDAKVQGWMQEIEGICTKASNIQTPTWGNCGTAQTTINEIWRLIGDFLATLEGDQSTLESLRFHLSGLVFSVEDLARREREQRTHVLVST